MLEKHTSEMYLPATPCLEAIAKSPSDARAFSRWKAFSDFNDKPGVFELRAYQLELGYNPIPKLVAHMAEGLPSKLASDPDENGALIGMFYSDVGRLNRFVEVWRYDHAETHRGALSAQALRRGARASETSRPWCRCSTRSSRSPRGAHPRSREHVRAREVGEAHCDRIRPNVCIVKVILSTYR